MSDPLQQYQYRFAVPDVENQQIVNILATALDDRDRMRDALLDISAMLRAKSTQLSALEYKSLVRSREGLGHV